MKHVLIENPVINGPFEQPTRHFKFSEDGITSEIIEGKRRVSSYFVPIPRPRKRTEQLIFESEWTEDRLKENEFINQVRGRVAAWRQGRYFGVTRTTARLLEYWTNPDREKRLFFCQIEALETAIYIIEVMNTVGKPGKLGEHVKCVVSVSMLTEGWDATTVSHILGVRAFGTQLLCEQVVGRGLRRRSYAVGESGKLDPEYAEVFGVPFSFIPCAGSSGAPVAPRSIHHVKALEERVAVEITFPRLTGYRYDLPTKRLGAQFTDESHMTLSTQDVATWTENAPIVGEHAILTLDDMKRQREQYVAFTLARLVLEKYFRDDHGNLMPYLFPQVLAIARDWLDRCVVCKGDAFRQLLLMAELAQNAADRIYQSIVQSDSGEKRIKLILKPYDSEGSTRYVSFDTTRAVYATRPDKCHINYVVADTESWEQKMAQTLEQMDEVHSYVKNHGLGFEIPYTLEGRERHYSPDFIARIDDGHGPDDLLNVIIGVSGAARTDKEAKVATAKTLWVPAVNNHGRFGRWAFLEIKDPWDARTEILRRYSERGGETC